MVRKLTFYTDLLIPAPLGYDFEMNPKNIIWLPLSTKSF